MAVSFDTVSERAEHPDYSYAAAFAAKLARFLLAQERLPQGILFNVNIPYLPAG